MFSMKNMRKLVSILLCIALLGGVLAGCGAGKKAELSVVAMTGPTGIGMVKLMADSEAESTEVDYTFELVGAADEITGKIVNGDVDIAAVPCNLASVLYNKTQGAISVLAVNTKGVLYILEAGGESIQSVADLAGKTIVSTGKGTTPEYTLNYLLTSNGLNPETDVTIEYKSEATEVVAALKQGLCDVAMLPQPMVTAAMAQVSD
ncbi:MAG: ABC transporter substrate-binding protein, partial [Peptococcaceae bacterium]|nr:ABC transporter substrate-binding protein [Peptococcaceae bacterium]